MDNGKQVFFSKAPLQKHQHHRECNQVNNLGTEWDVMIDPRICRHTRVSPTEFLRRRASKALANQDFWVSGEFLPPSSARPTGEVEGPGGL